MKIIFSLERASAQIKRGANDATYYEFDSSLFLRELSDV
jgi:hypothetical protein